MKPTERITVIMIDEDIDSRRLLVERLNDIPSIDLIAVGYSMTDGLRLLLRENAQVFIVGPTVPTSMLAATRALRIKQSDLRIVRLLGHDSDVPSGIAQVDAWLRLEDLESGLADLFAARRKDIPS